MSCDKAKAVSYIKENKIDAVLQATLNELFIAQPSDVYGYLSDEVGKFSRKPTISIIAGYGVKSNHDDSQRAYIEISCNINNHARVMEGCVIGHEVADDSSLDELKAVNDSLIGADVENQQEIDNKLRSAEISDSMRLSVSVATHKTSAKLNNISTLEALKALAKKDAYSVPVPIVTLLNGGKQSGGKNNLASLCICADLKKSFSVGLDVLERIYMKVEDLLKKKFPNNCPSIGANGGLSYSCDKVELMFELVKEAATELELTPEEDFYFILDCSASDFHTEVAPGQGSAKKGQSTSRHRYDWVEGQVKPSEDFCDYLENLVETENIVTLIDPLHHEDEEGLARLREKLASCHILNRGSANIVKMQSTLTGTIATLQAAQGFKVLEAATHEEGETILADLALVSGCEMMLLGGLRGCRRALYNQINIRLQQNYKMQPALQDWGFPEKTAEEE